MTFKAAGVQFNARAEFIKWTWKRQCDNIASPWYGVTLWSGLFSSIFHDPLMVILLLPLKSSYQEHEHYCAFLLGSSMYSQCIEHIYTHKTFFFCVFPSWRHICISAYVLFFLLFLLCYCFKPGYYNSLFLLFHHSFFYLSIWLCALVLMEFVLLCVFRVVTQPTDMPNLLLPPLLHTVTGRFVQSFTWLLLVASVFSICSLTAEPEWNTSRLPSK